MRNFSNIQKIVIKIGTNTLSKSNSFEIDYSYIKQLAKQISQLRKKNIQVALVTSGAIGMGAGCLHLDTVDGPKKRQACAAIGQPLLMDAYKRAFNTHNIKIAQVLLTSDVLDNKVTYRNLRNAIDQLFEMNVIPILNENDCVSTEEINMAFGDNDKLSARVASKIEADLLILLTDIDALYNKDPKHKDATSILLVKEITKEIEAAAGGAGTKHATGGMKSKIEAVKIAFEAGCRIVMANGRESDIISKIINGKEVGTLFIPESSRKLNDHQRWIVNSSSVGKIKVENIQCIRRKIKKQQDILPREILCVDGVFPKKSIVILNETFKAIIQLDSDEIKKVYGKTQGEVKKILGKSVIAIKSKDIIQVDY